MPQCPVIDELDDDCFLVLDRFKFLKPVGPKERPKAIRQVRVLNVRTRIHSDKARDYRCLQYTQRVRFSKVLSFRIRCVLAPFPGLCYNDPNRPSCNLGGWKNRPSANQRIYAAALGKEPCRTFSRFAAYGLYRPDVEERTGCGECEIFFDRSLGGWAVPFPRWR